MLGALAACGLLASGCVERRMKIATNPPGALVTVNDEEVGPSPAKFNFLWYGDYDIIVRKPGYETLKTHYRIDPPWWQRPIIDIIPETLLPWTIVDEHTLPTLELVPLQPTTNAELMERAAELRDQAVFQP
jgi:hypothetical protein